MEKLSVITDEVSQNLKEVIEFAHQFHLQGLELRSMNDRSPFDFTPSDRDEVIRRVEDSGLKLCALALPLYKCSIHNQEERARQIEGLSALMDLANRLDCKLIRGFAFLNEGGEMPLCEIVEAYQPIIERLEDADMTVVLEAEPSVWTTNAKKLRTALKAIDHPRVKAVFDGANLLHDSEGERPVPEAYDILKPWICHVHIKDAVREGDIARTVPVGKGDADILGQLRRLLADGYGDWISLETHFRAKALSEAETHLPAGSQFSLGGLEASTESMGNLHDILASIKST